VRADVYAMGVILFEMLTGELPYGPATSLAGVLLAIEQQEPRAASMLDPRLDREIDAILGKALAKSREARYPSVEALAADLRRHQLGEPVLAHPPSRWYKLRKHLARHPISSGLAAALLLCVLTFGVVSWVQARRIGEERNLAVKATESEALARSEAERAEKAARDALREATVERGRAIRSADKAGAVLAFLLDDMLGTAHPERRGAGTKVIEAMDAALGRIRGRLDGEPEVEAAVRSVAGELYLALGQNEKAGPELEQALALRDLLPGVPAADLVASLIALGNLRISSSECDRALPLLERAVALSEEDEAGSPGVLAAAVNALGTCLSSKGRYGEAEAAFHRALDLYADSASKPGQGSVSVLRGLAEVKLRKGDFGAADRISRQVLRGTIDTLGRESLEAAADMVMRGDLLHELGKYKESEDTFREALAVHRKILGSLHPHIAQDLLKIGVSLTSVGDYDGAGACFEEALEIECRVLGPAAAEAGESVGMLAMTLAAKNRLAEAVAIVERSLSRVKCLLGEEHPVIPNLMTNLATFVHQKGDVERGKALVEEALAMRKRLLGPRHPHIAHTLNAKGVILKVEGDDAGALAAYTEALDILKDSYGGDDHPLMIIVLNNLGTLKLDLEETEAALSYFREAYRISKEAGLPDAQEDVDRARFGFVSSLLRSKEFAEAETVMREIVEACRKAFPENDRHLLGAESLLANALVGVGKYDEAEALLCRLWERISGIDDTTDAERQGVILKLVMLYEHWGRGDAALKWRAKLPAAESRRGGRSGE
jgi:tetratricopeptide (TPR) repeat protein